MGNPANHNSGTTQTRCAGHFDETQIQKMVSAAADALQFPAEVVSPIRHLYVHIPFCARICPYCAFYKDLLDRSQTSRFCEAILSDLDLLRTRFAILPETIYFGGGTPTALTTGQLEFLLKRFAQHLDLSSLQEWTIEANPGSVSARKAALRPLPTLRSDRGPFASRLTHRVWIVSSRLSGATRGSDLLLSGL